MTIVKRTLILTALGFLVPALTAQAVTTACQVPNNVRCEISDPDGIQRVIVRSETPFGTVDVVNQEFECESPVSIAYDSAVSNVDLIVTTCGDLPILPGLPGEGGIFNLTSNGTVERRTVKRPKKHKVPVRKGLAFASVASLRLLKPSGGDGRPGVLLTRPTLIAVSPDSDPVEDSFCCNEGTMTGCFAVDLLAQCGEGLDYVFCVEDEDALQSVCESFPN